MSKVNIKRTVENIRANTTVYSPIVEAVVNAIQAIESTGRTDGKITVRIYRDDQMEIEGALSEVRAFDVEDNGIGFTPENRESFDTLYSDFKMAEGGKGFGRFIWLKYFENVLVDSVYREKGGFKRRTFAMGLESDIITKEKVTDAKAEATGTVVSIKDLKDNRSIDKKLNTIARNLVEKLLPSFLARDHPCPEIVLTEAEGSEFIRLNDWLSSELSDEIREITVENGDFSLKAIESDELFQVRVFKLYFPKSQKSRISLVAHRREVSGSPIHTYVPELIDDFYDKDDSGNSVVERNFIVT